MKEAEIFGKRWGCPCGKTHHIAPKAVVYGGNAAERLPDFLAGETAGRNAGVLMDTRTRVAAGDMVMDALEAAGWRVVELVVADGGAGESPVCDDVTKSLIDEGTEPVDAFVPVGGGVISDLGKWLAFDRGVPYVVFGTAASMNGYASANVAPTLRGVKSLVRARPPAAVFSSPEVLREAPYHLTASGLGDILAKSVSSLDWKMNQILFGDYYCERSVGLIADIEPLYLEHPGRVKARDAEALKALFLGLQLTGAAMTMAESSAPASGGEHLISHTLDMLASVDGVSHDLHGRQVGIGTLLMAVLYKRLLERESPDFDTPYPALDRSRWGSLADAVAEKYDEKPERLEVARQKLRSGAEWDSLRAALAPMARAPETIRDCLKEAGAACRAEDIGIDAPRLREALHHAHEIRSRFSVLDLALLCGELPAAEEELIAWVH